MTAMLNRFRFPARKVSSSTSSGSSSAAASSPSELESPATTVSLGLAPSSSLGKLPDPQPESETASEVAEPENVPPPQTAMAGEQRDAANAAAAPPKKARRKSYGGIRAMLGKTRTDSISDAPPPVPSLVPLAPPHPRAVSPAPSPSKSPKRKPPHLAIQRRDSSSSSVQDAPLLAVEARLGLTPSPPPIESRPSTSSLRPFPFLGIRRKSSNQNVGKDKERDELSKSPPSPGFGWGQRIASRQTPFAASYAKNSKKAQSVDDLSQFGLLPERPSKVPLAGPADAGGGKRHFKPRRSVELERQAPPTSSSGGDLHKSLDRIGEMAGSLAGMRSPGAPQNDRTPRLSNPKGMRTVYGVSLQDLFWRDGDEYPLFLTTMVRIVEDRGIKQQGIYRVPGEKRVIEEVQAAVDERGVKHLDIWKASSRDVHNVAGAIKLWMREVPGGIVPFAQYDDFIGVSAVSNEGEKTQRLKQLVASMPEPNRILLEKIVRHFVNVVAYASENSMLAHNLAIVFAPSLFRSGSEHSNPLLSMQNIGKASAIVRHLILNADAVFAPEDDDDDASSVKDESSSVTTAATSNLAPEITTTGPDGNKDSDNEEEVERLATPVLAHGRKPE